MRGIETELGAPLPESFRDDFSREILSAFARELKGVEGVRQAIEGLRARVCVASSSGHERLRLSLRAAGYETLFAPNIFSAADVAEGKPSPDLFLHAARAMGVEPKDCLVIEDSVAGVVAARAAGMTVFGFVGASHFSPLDEGAHLTAAGAELLFDDDGAAARPRRREGDPRGRCEARTEAMARKSDQDGLRLDEAARAGWLYYVAGNTQDEIARKLGISRQAAQRLVSLAISERLIKVRLDHPIARCMELAAALKLRYDLRFCEVAPTDPASTSSTLGIAQVAAAEFERWLRRSEPAIIGIGTGRTMRAVADQLPAMECPQHKLVALVGTTKTDGSASFYDVIIRVSDSVRAPHYPMPLPVIARSVEERELLTSLASVKSLFDLVERTDVSFVGVGAVGDSAALVQDGIITRQEAEALRQLGAVGEITGWAFDAAGKVLAEGTNQRVASAPLRRADNRLVIGVAMGPSRRAPVRGALAGRLISGLVTDEATAEHLLQR